MARMKKPTSFDDLGDLLRDIHHRLENLEYTVELVRKHSQNLNRRLLKFLDETPKKKKDDEYLTPKAVATLLSISTTAVHGRMKSGSIHSIEIPGSGKSQIRRIPRSELDRILRKKSGNKGK
ncbi:MAG: helix-turn-helix domain-containing protein [Planctomycetota bacterium]